MNFIALILSFLLAFPVTAGPWSDPAIVTILFSADVSDTSAVEMTQAFGFAQENSADAILLVINSPGGSVKAGWEIVKLIRSAKMPVHCVVDGEASSMAFIMLQACTTRGMTAESKLLAHQPYVKFSSDEPMHINELKSLLNRLVVLAEQMDIMAASRMGMPLSEYQARTNAIDWWMSSISALKLNAVDYISSNLEVVQKSLRTTGSLPR